MRRGKRALALLVAAALLLGLTGCGVFDTRMARAVQKMSKLNSLRLDLTAEMTLSLATETAGESAADAPLLKVPAACTGGIDLFTDPLLARSEFTLALPGRTSGLSAYLEKTETCYNLYSLRTTGSIWQKQGFTELDKAKVTGLKYIVQGAETFVQGEEESVNGSPAVRYDGTVVGEYLEGLLELYGVWELLTDGFGFQLAPELFRDMEDVPASLWLDSDSGMIVRVSLDLTGLGAQMGKKQLEDLRKGSGFDALGLSVALDSFVVTVDLSQFDAVEPFAIPEEAQAAWGETKQPWEK